MKKLMRILAVLCVCLALCASTEALAARKGAKRAKRAAKPAAASQAAKKQAEAKPEEKAAKQAGEGQPDGGSNNISMKDIYGIKPAAAPEGEEFKATPVAMPEKMHVGSEDNPYTAEIGGVPVNPIPRVGGSD